QGTVLLAEDNEINQKVAKTMLLTLGLDVDVVANGREAINALDLKSYDLILMDCQMPEVDGYEASRMIRSKEAALATGADKPHIPIIALTAHAMEGDRELCLAAGMDDYLSKPFNSKGLSELIERWLPGRKTGETECLSEVNAVLTLAGLSKSATGSIQNCPEKRSIDGKNSDESGALDKRVA